MPQPGTLIEGKYEILGKIREGGMGAIYKVRHKLLDEIRVVKVMRPEMVGDEELRRRFVEEAKTATRLKHPHIGTIHDFALDDDGTAYLVMEFIEGVNLADLTFSGRLPSLSVTLEIAHQALLALAYLHRKGIVHRDVAPDNLMLAHDEDGRPHVKVIDLGIAKATDREHKMTSTGVFLGKLKYASPELFGSLPPGEKLDGRSDLYSLGIVMYELLTGARPFSGNSPAELLRAHLFLSPVPFEKSDPEGRVPPDVRAVVLKALQKKREDRFASAEDFDREILALRQKYGSPEELQNTQVIVARARPTRDSSAATVTPSAQDRLDRHFGPGTTPAPGKSYPPLGPTLTAVPPVGVSSAEAGTQPPPVGVSSADARTQLLTSPPAPARAPARRSVGPIVAGLVLISVAGAAWWLAARRPARPIERTPQPTPAARTQVEVGTAATPEALPTLQPSAVPPEGARPTAPPPTETQPLDEAARRDAERARNQTVLSRQNARNVRAAEVAPAEFEKVTAQNRRAQALFDRGDFAAALTAFERATQLFNAAQTRADALQREARQATSVPTTALHPTARHEPTRAAPTVIVEVPRPTSLPAEPARPSEVARIRDLVARYQQAQSTLDADAYARIYPGADAQKIRAAFEQLRSQSVVFEIDKIEIAPGGTSATVRGRETRNAVPRAGSDVHFAGPRVLQLEKRGDAWVIARLGS